MQSRIRPRTERPSASPTVVVAAIVALLVFVCFLGYVYMGPGIGRRGAVSHASETRYLRQMALQCRGDLSKLSQQDRDRVQKLCNGRASAMLSIIAARP